MQQFRSLSALMLGAAIAALTTPAMAQDVASPAAADTVGIADIVVTAQKRATNIQDTPIAMRAFDNDAVLKAGITAPVHYQDTDSR